MEGNGKGSLLLLLLMASLLLCKDVACHPPCGNRCPPSYGALFRPAVNLSESMFSSSDKLFQDFEAKYSKDSFYFMPAIHLCHTANIIAPDDSKHSSQVEYKDDLRFIVRLLYSWNEPLLHLVNEAHRLPGISTHLKNKVKRIARQSQKLQKLMKNVANQFDPEITRKVDYAAWTGLPSLQSADEETRLFATYNLLRCLSQPSAADPTGNSCIITTRSSVVVARGPGLQWFQALSVPSKELDGANNEQEPQLFLRFTGVES
ncbi:prolactin-like [Erethizon dorsatum]